MGVDTESFGVSYVNIVRDFQQHMLYGFFIGVLIAMANTSAEELDRLIPMLKGSTIEQMSYTNFRKACYPEI